jgi:hypothetical protein
VRARQTLLLALTCVSLGFVTDADAQISPGPLATPHAELDGNRDCLSCHAAGQGVDPGKCLSCHAILQERVAAGAGLHARKDYADCRLCHVDHNGRDFELVWWGDAGMDGFDHEQTGTSLTGAHQKLECRDCHKAALVQDAGRFREARKNLDRTFLGLATECAACHQDAHRGQLGAADCASCHTTEVWTPAPDFDHEKTSFALAGAHARLECAQCHAEESDADGIFRRFKPVPHEQCTACHRDVHEGALGPRCESCHGTDSWFSTPGFDHAKTRYPLTGLHRRVGCSDCHRTENRGLQFRDLAFGQCSDCHRDPHEARLGADCASCHNTGGWQGITQGSFDHARTRYPLEGAHARTECAACHPPGKPLAILGFDACATCHADEHVGQLARRDDEGACSSCHSVEAFKPALFSEEDHAATRYPLLGLHQGVTCSKCHAETAFRKVGSGEVVTTAKFRYESLACTECHEDPHRGTTDQWLAQGGCATCHSEAGWKVPVFDHATTKFALEGAHVPLACNACHGLEPGAEDERRLLLTGTPSDCAGCHQEPHGGQFASREGGCAACHSSTAWNVLFFDHNRDSSYRLEGAHAAAPCSSCHLPDPGTRQAADPTKPVVRYVPLPTRCEACHAGS